MKSYKNILGLLAVCFYLFAFVDSSRSVYLSYYAEAKGDTSHAVQQEIENAEVPYRWFEITHSIPGNFSNHQEQSGGGIVSVKFIEFVHFLLPEHSHLTSYFELFDQRALIFQYLYPFYFFF